MYQRKLVIGIYDGVCDITIENLKFVRDMANASLSEASMQYSDYLRKRFIRTVSKALDYDWLDELCSNERTTEKEAIELAGYVRSITQYLLIDCGEGEVLLNCSGMDEWPVQSVRSDNNVRNLIHRHLLGKDTKKYIRERVGTEDELDETAMNLMLEQLPNDDAVRIVNSDHDGWITYKSVMPLVKETKPLYTLSRKTNLWENLI